MNLDLQNYVNGAVKAGQSKEKISQDLKSNGWTDTDISEVLNASFPAPVINITSKKPYTFNNKTLLVGIVLVMLIGVFLFIVLNKFSSNPLIQNGNSVEYIHSSGLFTLSYPKDWSILGPEGYDVYPGISLSTGLSFIFGGDSLESGSGTLSLGILADEKTLSAYYNPEAISKSGYKVSPIEEINLGETVVRKFKFGRSASVNTVYIFPTEKGDIHFLVVTDIVEPKTIKQIESVLATLSINESKIAELQIEAKARADNAAIKSYLSSLRASSEIYYDSNSNSYSGLCKNKEKYYVDSVSYIEKTTGNKIMCNDTKNEYALSAKLINSEFYCIDSTGFMGKVVGYHTGTKCPPLVEEKESYSVLPVRF